MMCLFLFQFDYENFDSQSIDLSFLEGKQEGQDENAWKSKKVEMKKAIREKLQAEVSISFSIQPNSGLL